MNAVTLNGRSLSEAMAAPEGTWQGALPRLAAAARLSGLLSIRPFCESIPPRPPCRADVSPAPPPRWN